MRPDLQAAMLQQRVPQPPQIPQAPQMPPHDDAIQDLQMMNEVQSGNAGPAIGEAFRQALNIAAQELGRGAPPQAVQARAAQILQIAGIVPSGGGQGGQQMAPQGGAPMQPQMPPQVGMPPAGMPPRPGGM